jgi:hypothetical protein
MKDCMDSLESLTKRRETVLRSENSTSEMLAAYENFAERVYGLWQRGSFVKEETSES